MQPLNFAISMSCGLLELNTFEAESFSSAFLSIIVWMAPEPKRGRAIEATMISAGRSIGQEHRKIGKEFQGQTLGDRPMLEEEGEKANSKGSSKKSEYE